MLRQEVWLILTSVSEVLGALLMEAARTSETSANLYQTTRCVLPEDCNPV
jgi:hypothetical protein